MAERERTSLPMVTVPIPDPTVLTTQQLLREIATSREIVETSIKGLRELHEERFASISNQFIERDVRTEQASRDSKVAVDAALKAAKEAVEEQNKSNALAIAKSEAGFTKQIDQIGILVSTTQKGNDERFEDIKGRLVLLEGVRRGGSEIWAYMIAIAGLAIAILAIFYKH